MRVDGTRCCRGAGEGVEGGGVWGGASDLDPCPNPSPALITALLTALKARGDDPSCRHGSHNPFQVAGFVAVSAAVQLVVDGVGRHGIDWGGRGGRRNTLRGSGRATTDR